jgi:hypothetical protein
MFLLIIVLFVIKLLGGRALISPTAVSPTVVGNTISIKL